MTTSCSGCLSFQTGSLNFPLHFEIILSDCDLQNSKGLKNYNVAWWHAAQVLLPNVKNVQKFQRPWFEEHIFYFIKSNKFIVKLLEFLWKIPIIKCSCKYKRYCKLRSEVYNHVWEITCSETESIFLFLLQIQHALLHVFNCIFENVPWLSNYNIIVLLCHTRRKMWSLNFEWIMRGFLGS